MPIMYLLYHRGIQLYEHLLMDIVLYNGKEKLILLWCELTDSYLIH